MILAFEALNVSVPIQFGGSGLVDQAIFHQRSMYKEPSQAVG